MRKIWFLFAVLFAATMSACGSSSSDSPPPAAPPPAAFPKPAGTVAVNFSVDDSINKVFRAGELQWKGAMVYDSTTRKIGAPDSSWGGPFATLYDDGPWSAGGHEPAGATAGDHKWGITVFVTPPATGTNSYAYGLIDHAFGDGWIWPGPGNGGFDVAAGATADITALGTTLAAFGTTDLRIVIDTHNLDPGGTWDTGKVAIKGSAFAWYLTTLLDNGALGDVTAADGKYTFVLSNYVGAGKLLYHTGLAHSGDDAQFIFTFGATDKEYKVGGAASAVGVTADYKPALATTWSTLPVGTGFGQDKNTYLHVP